MATIFISYRRDDTGADAGRLCDHLGAHFGDERVFMDVDDITPGSNFVTELDRTLAGADVLLVMIGPQWLDAAADGVRRLDDINDFVRSEVVRGLDADVHVIPVLVRDARMPSADELPEPMAGLARRQAIELSDTRFRADVERLIDAIESIPGLAARPKTAHRFAPAVAAAVFVVLALAVGTWLLQRGGSVRLRDEPAVLSIDAARAMVTANGFYDVRSNPGGAGLRNRFGTKIVGDDIMIVDGTTGLSWEKAGSGYWDRFDIGRATTRIGELNARSFGGHTDWRLPTLEEAMSLMEPEKAADYHIDAVFAAQEAPQMLTADRTEGGSVWVVYLYDGFCLPESPGYNAWIRAVRGPE